MRRASRIGEPLQRHRGSCQDTTGCLVIALNRAAAVRLAAYFKSRKWVTKEVRGDRAPSAWNDAAGR